MTKYAKPLLLTALLAGVAFATAPAHAGGFYLQEQSTKALGSAFAGAGADARDASIMYYNPAGITQLSGAQITGGVSVLKAWESNHNTGSTLFGAPTTGGTSDDAIPFTELPHLYAAMPVPGLENRLWAGIGVSVPFGLSTKYDSDWFGRYDSISSELTVIDIQPTLAFKATDWLSIGGGVNIQRAIADLTNAVSNGGATTGKAELTGNDWDVGYNLGVMLTPVKGTNIGLDYRTRVDHTLKGSIVVTGLTGAGNSDNAGSADLNLPDVYGISLAQDLTPQWKLLGQVNHFHWSRFHDITAVTSAGAVAESITEDYQNTWSYAIGAEYAWTPDFTVRFGYQYDQTPTHSPYRDTRVPDGNRNNFGVGASYNLMPDLTLDLAATYSLMADSNVSVQRNVLAGVPRANVNASRDDTSFAFGSVGLTFRF